MAHEVDRLLDGRLNKLEAECVCPHQIKHYMESKGWACSDLDTNGWEYDWWLTFTKDGKSFSASGSGYYGWFELAPTEE